VDALGELGHLAIDQYQVDLGVRDPERLDQMFNRGVLGHRRSKPDLPTAFGKKVVEFGVEPYGDGVSRCFTPRGVLRTLYYDR